jgi:hypothetical protein
MCGFGLFFALLSVVGCLPLPLIGHWTFDAGQERADLTGNFADLTLDANSAIESGALICARADAQVSTGRSNSIYRGPEIVNKTFVVWLSLETHNASDRLWSFDSKDGGMADSDAFYFNASNLTWFTKTPQASFEWRLFPESASNTNTIIQLAFTYRWLFGTSFELAAFRDGALIGAHNAMTFAPIQKSNRRQMTFCAPFSRIGLKIYEARLYSAPLTQTELSQLTLTSCVAAIPTSRPFGRWLVNDTDESTVSIDVAGPNNGLFEGGPFKWSDGSSADGPMRFVSLTNTSVRFGRFPIGLSDFHVSLWARPTCLDCPLLGQRSTCGRGVFWNVWLLGMDQAVSGPAIKFELDDQTGEVGNEVVTNFALARTWYKIEFSRIGMLLTLRIVGTASPMQVQVTTQTLNDLENLYDFVIGAWDNRACANIARNYSGDIADVTLSIDRLPFLQCAATVAPAELSTQLGVLPTVVTTETRETLFVSVSSPDGASPPPSSVLPPPSSVLPIAVGVGVGGAVLLLIVMIAIVVTCKTKRNKATGTTQTTTAAEEIDLTAASSIRSSEYAAASILSQHSAYSEPGDVRRSVW